MNATERKTRSAPPMLRTCDAVKFFIFTMRGIKEYLLCDVRMQSIMFLFTFLDTLQLINLLSWRKPFNNFGYNAKFLFKIFVSMSYLYYI